MPGMYAQVDLAVPRKNPPLLIPGDTLVVRSDGPQVAVVGPDGVVHYTRMQLGRDFGDRLEVLSGFPRATGWSSTPATSSARASRSKRSTLRRRSGKSLQLT